MNEITFDWLYQLEREAWERRVRELRRELNNERMLAQKQKSAPIELVELVPAQTLEHLQPQQLQLALTEITSPSPLETRQKLTRAR